MEKFILDACVLLAWLNRRDQYHQICLKFVTELDERIKRGEKIRVVIPMHSFVEVNINVRKKKKNKEWQGFPSFRGSIDSYPIDERLLARIQDGKLYDVFDKLRPADSIYGMIAYLDNMTLVTIDKDFESVKDLIKIKLL